MDFWARYNALADKHDGVMLDRLNRNLDVLLIFAGLFLAINTTFIILTLTNLSAPSSYQTNVLLTLIVMQANNSTSTPTDLNPNCMFFASLGASVLAAAGAMLAKQWIQSYERTGQTGSRENQAMRRTEKRMGSERWGLRPIVESLPTLLLTSLGLFFLALGDLLWTINGPVAIVFIALAGVGVLSYGLTMVAAAIDVNCPFQTAASTVLRTAATETSRITLDIFALFPFWDSITRGIRDIAATGQDALARSIAPLHKVTVEIIHLVRKLHLSWCSLWRKMWKSSVPERNSGIWETWRERRDKRRRKIEPAEIQLCRKEVTRAQASLWMPENATENEDLKIVVESITSLRSTEAVRLVANSPFLPRLVQEFENALSAASNTLPKRNLWSSLITTSAGAEVKIDALATALGFGKAVAHVLLADPEPCWRLISKALPRRGVRIMDIGSSVMPNGPEQRQLKSLCTALAVLAEEFEPLPSAINIACLLQVSYAGWEFGLLAREVGHSDALFSLVCLEIMDLGIGARRPRIKRLRDAQDARNEFNISAAICGALRVQDTLLQTGHDRRRLLELHTELLAAFRCFHSRSLSDHEEEFINGSFRMSIVIPHLSRILSFLKSDATSLASTASRDETGVTQDMRTSSKQECEPRIRLGGWEYRLSRSPARIEVLREELKVYAIQLLLCLSLKGLFAQGSYPRISASNALVIMDGVVTLADEVTTDADMANLLKILWISSLSLIGKQSDHNSSKSADLSAYARIIPFVLCSLSDMHTSPEVFQEAYRLLQTMGHEAAASDHVLEAPSPLVMDNELNIRLI
ncbi:hypothetical protein FRB98_006202 [Tulasnella sp. 332]|nr:hypothetical protein FRB98_006202 [Tulasnella sp. 332]